MRRKINDYDDYKTIPTTECRYSKKGSKWVLDEKRKYLSSPKMHKNVTDNNFLRFFRNLGGYEKNEYRYTRRGYVATKNTSISPNRDTKIVRSYDCNNTKLNDRALNWYRKSYGKRK